jgi:hypothetical protein
MANVLMNPQDAAAAADVPNIGAPAAPAGDTPGTNPFHGLALPDESQPPVSSNEPQSTQNPAPAPAPQAPPPQPAPSGNPFDGFAMPGASPSQGTATATAAGSGVGAGQVPSGGASSGANPFDGFQAAQEARPEAPAAPSPKEQKSLGTSIYQGAKALALNTMEDLSNGAQMLWAQAQQPGGVIKAMPIMTDRKGQLWDDTKMQSGARGAAMIGTAPLAPAEALVPNLAEGFFAKTLTGKVLAQIANGEFAGAVYGSVAPLEGDETRWDSIKDNAYGLGLQVPLMHGAFKALGWPIGKALEKLGIPQKIADAMRRPGVTADHITEANKQVEDLLQVVKDNGANPAHLPEPIKEDLVALSIHNAVDQPEIANLDERTAAWEQASQDTHGVVEINPRTLGSTAASEVTGLTPPRDVLLPEPAPGEGQVRLSQGVYQNPDGTIEAYGYRGVSRRPMTPEELRAAGKDEVGFSTGLVSVERKPTDPGLMDTIYMSPNPSFAAGFGDLHYVGAKFERPLVIDDWHNTLPDSRMESQASKVNDQLHSSEGSGGHLTHPKYGNVNFLGTRQPGVIDAARLAGYDAIIVKHGNEGVEIVALHPEKVYSAGAAPTIAAADNFGTVPDLTPVTDQQKLISDKAGRLQRGVKDLGTSDNPALKALSGLRNGDTFSNQSTDPTKESIYEAMFEILKQHDNVSESPLDFVGKADYGSHLAGTYKINDKVIKVEPADGRHN